MTIDEILNKFDRAFPLAMIDDYRPICHELFTDGKEGLTIWLKNGDVIEYYPKAENDAQKMSPVTPQRPEGRWIATENEEMNIDGYFCSCCDLPMETEERTKYCPNCGAKMKAESEDVE